MYVPTRVLFAMKYAIAGLECGEPRRLFLEKSVSLINKVLKNEWEEYVSSILKKKKKCVTFIKVFVK